MKLTFIYLSFFVLFFAKCDAKHKKNAISNKISILEDTLFAKENVIKDTTKTLYFDSDLFNAFYIQDKILLSDSIRSKYLKLSNKVLLDSAKKCVYGTPFMSLQKGFTEEKAQLQFELGLNLLLLCMERELADAYAMFGDILKLHDNTKFNLKNKLKNKQKYEQYLLKSVKMGSILGNEILAYWYMAEYKNIKEGIKIYHYLADSLNDESGIFELYRFYRDGYYDVGENKSMSNPHYEDSLKREYYFEKLIKMKNIYALDIKADILWRRGEKEDAYVYYVECFLWYYKSGKDVEFRESYMHQYDELLMERYRKKWEKYKKSHKINIKK